MTEYRKKIIVAVGSTFLVLSALGVTSAWFFLWQIVGLYDSARELEIESKQLEEELDVAQELERSIIEFQNRFSEVEKSFFKKDSIVQLLEMFEKMAERLSLTYKISGAQIGFEEAGKKVSRFRFTVSGHFERTLLFIRKLENAPFFITLESADFRKEQTGVVTVALVIRTESL